MKLFLISGFLGSGKTTAISNACAQLMNENRKVAVVTNDQGDQQVDSAYLFHRSIPVREVASGCFCCNFNQLDNHVQSLLETEHPEIIFAESVGSCTDIIATVARPFNKFRPLMEVSISVFVDASLLLALLDGRASFIADNIRYIYKKQLEEADVLVVNKSDLETREQLEKIDSMLNEDYPGKIILHQNSKSEKDIQNWLQLMGGFKSDLVRPSLEIDYDRYADGEAKLAWLDQSISIVTSRNNSTQVAELIAREIYAGIVEQSWLIGHLKFFIEAADWKKKLSFTATGSDSSNSFANQPTVNCNVLINARVQTEPEDLKRLVDRVIVQAAVAHDCRITTQRKASFKPGYPRPTHRIINQAN